MASFVRTIFEEDYLKFKTEMEKEYPGCNVDILARKSGKLTVGISFNKDKTKTIIREVTREELEEYKEKFRGVGTIEILSTYSNGEKFIIGIHYTSEKEEENKKSI